MLNVIFTIDYEIHGNGDGCPYALMVKPTSRLLDLLEKHGAKLTIMADVAEILKFREYRDQFGRDNYHYEPIIAQLKDAIGRGHDVQLHLHCSYFNSRFERGKWMQDWSEYNFAALSEQRLNEVLRIGREFLEEQLRPIDSSYRCNVFRAANWAVTPSHNVVRALVNNGFQIDTSVFKYGRREGVVNFDYSRAPSNLVPWMVDENDICQRDEKSGLLEVPIYAERRWIGAFMTLQRIHRAWLSRRHRVASASGDGDASRDAKAHRGRRLTSLIRVVTQRHAWKADFNQCPGKQLIRALERAAAVHPTSESLPFVLIGHSKLFGRCSENSVRVFLQHVAWNPEKFNFGKFNALQVCLRPDEMITSVGAG
jgi:hypothetical protein